MSNNNKFAEAVGGSKNLGTLGMSKDTFGMISRVLILPATNTAVTRANALLKATWDALLLNPVSSRAYVTPQAEDVLPITQAQVDYTSKGKGTISRIKEYAPAFNVVLGEENEYFYRNMLGFDKQAVKVILFDANGNMAMTESGADLNGYDASIEVGSRQLTDGTKHREYMVKISLTSLTQYKNKSVILKPIDNTTLSWAGSDLQSLRDVDVEIVGTPTATSCVVKVIYTDSVAGNIAGLSQSTPKVDFVVNGLSAGVTASTPNSDGTYTLTGTFANTNTVGLNIPSALSVKAVNPIECINPATVSGIV